MSQLRVDFHEALSDLEDEVLQIGHRAQELVPMATAALLAGDEEQAQAVLHQDDEIDMATHHVEHEILEMLALQGPVASDLRLLVSLIHVIRHLERIGDYAVNVARLAPLVAGLDGDPEIIAQLREMGQRAERAVAVSLDAFRSRAADGVSMVEELEEPIDVLHEGLVRRLIDHAAGAEPERAPWAVRMILATRHFERIGDHAVGVAAEGAFVATGHRRPPRALR